MTGAGLQPKGNWGLAYRFSSLPDGTLPLCISKYLSPSEMQHQLGLKPLSFELWFEHFKLNYEEQDLLYA